MGRIKGLRRKLTIEEKRGRSLVRRPCFACGCILVKNKWKLNSWGGVCHKCSLVLNRNFWEQRAKWAEKIVINKEEKNRWVKNISDAQLKRFSIIPKKERKYLPKKDKSEYLTRRGDRHPNWKGGVTSINMKLRNSKKYSEWRESVFRRDGYKCVTCNDMCSKNHRVTLHADHIKPFAVILQEIRKECNGNQLYDNAIIHEPLWAIDNGRTLCQKCHKHTETFGRKLCTLAIYKKVCYN